MFSKHTFGAHSYGWWHARGRTFKQPARRDPDQERRRLKNLVRQAIKKDRDLREKRFQEWRRKHPVTASC